jgi:hypothetical protein
MDADKQVVALLDLAKQHIQRFHQLENIEWRINFSVWAFVGGIAYFAVSGKVEILE